MRNILSVIILLLLNSQLVPATGQPTPSGAEFAEKADYYLETLCFDSAEFFYAKALPLLEESAGPELYATALNKFGSTLWWQSKFYEAEIVCRENLEICLHLFGYDHAITADAMVNLAALGFISGRFAMITEYLVQAIDIYEKHYLQQHPKVAKAYEWLGTYYEGMADQERGRKYLWKSYKIWREIRDEDDTDLGDIYRYMGLYHKRFLNHDSAVILFNKAKAIFDETYGPANFQSVKCLNNLADIYMENPNLEHKVIPVYEQCFLLISKFKSAVPMADVMTLFNLAKYHGLKGNHIQALELLNEALSVYIPDFTPADIFSNPDFNEVDYHQYLRIILATKADNFNKLYIEESYNAAEYLSASIKCLLLNDQITEDHKRRFVNLDDFLKFEHGYTQHYHGMAKINIEAFYETGDTACISRTLNFLNKNSLATNNNNPVLAINNYFEIPDHVFEKRYVIQHRINGLRSSLLRTSVPDKKKKLHLQLSRENIELDRFYYQQMKSENLIFRDQNRQMVYFSDLQNALGPEECLLIYSEYIPLNAVIPEKLLIVAITGNDFKSTILEGDYLFRQINQLYEKVSAGSTNETRELTDELYQKLLMPFEEILGKKIIIIPSPYLSRLSFEMLTIPQVHKDHKKTWLIQHYSIRKEFSPDTFMSNLIMERGSEPARVLAVAPTFNKSQIIQIAALTKRDTSLINLSGALSECENIANYFEATLLTGFTATKQRFADLSKDYNIIHLSTHGVPTKTDTLMMQLAFSADDLSAEDHMMSLFEVFNLNLKAGLVVLSACKTGYGKINHGLGSLSLNWAFSRAGARSTVISLWDVNDYASSKIMGALYRNLSQGYTKPDALRFAKLEYIQTHDELMGDPYYWAGFVYYGPDHALVNRSATYTGGIWMLLAGLLLLSGFLFLRKYISF